jgi:hypothetical protein
MPTDRFDDSRQGGQESFLPCLECQRGAKLKGGRPADEEAYAQTTALWKMTMNRLHPLDKYPMADLGSLARRQDRSGNLVHVPLSKVLSRQMVAGEFGSPGVIEPTRGEGHNKEAVAALRPSTL